MLNALIQHDKGFQFQFLNPAKVESALSEFKSQNPFDHCIVDDFFTEEIAHRLEEEFLNYDDDRWYYYKNALEDKKALNNWGAFPDLTYKVFSELISQEFLTLLSENIGIKLIHDPGLHGGGWHIHTKGGNLNPHLDYSIHPKLALERKLNLIVYLSSNLEEIHGGHLGLWEHDSKKNMPGKLIKSIEPKFNRAILFDTTQNSWHGMSKPLTQPDGIYRKSLAVYYLQNPSMKAANRKRALFAPRDNQKNDLSIRNLINKRSDLHLSTGVYYAEANK